MKNLKNPIPFTIVGDKKTLANLNKDVGAENDLECVVPDEKSPQVLGGPILHVVRAPHLDQVHVRRADRHRRKRTAKSESQPL
jgi:hypothetical protein